MAQDAIRTIIFDIGRVLVRVNVQEAQKRLSNGSPLSAREMWTAIENDPHCKDWQEGRYSARDWHLNLCKRFGVSLSFEQFVDAWNSALDPRPIHPDSLFAGLSKKYKLGLLSNTDPIHVAYLEKTYSFYQYFPETVRTYSCRMGAVKPDPLIFRHALKACKAKAQQTVYIDDIGAFAEAARGLGMHGIQYSSPEQLHAGLSSLSIIL
jgi:FMN phosphatase YigB (HAD superfamily)